MKSGKPFAFRRYQFRSLVAAILILGAVQSWSAGGSVIGSNPVAPLMLSETNIEQQKANEIAEFLEGICADFHEIHHRMSLQSLSRDEEQQLAQAEHLANKALTELQLYAASGDSVVLEDFRISYGNFVGWLEGHIKQPKGMFADEEINLQLTYLLDDIQWITESAGHLLVSGA